ncbi:MAG: helix-turn-helix domain-containing protein [Lactovum sp.]
MKESLILEKVYNATTIPMQLYKDGKVFLSLGVKDLSSPALLKLTKELRKANSPISYTISSGNIISGLIHLKGLDNFLILGPSMSSNCTLRQAESILSELNISKSSAKVLNNWLFNLPNIDLERFRQTLLLLDFLLNGESLNSTMYINSTQKEKRFKSILENSILYTDNVSDLLEKQLLSYVENGDIQAMTSAYNNLESENSASTNLDLRSYQNIFLFSIGLISRAAIKGGLDHNLTNSLVNIYISRIEEITTTNEASLLLKQMFLDFTRRTSESRLHLSNSLLVLKICKDIQSHIYEKSSPVSIAERLDMNYSYISRHFKEETGKTITEYINESKINESIRLMEISQLSIIEIALQLGFSSQNYFHTIFKKVTGKTPLEFKESKD